MGRSEQEFKDGWIVLGLMLASYLIVGSLLLLFRLAVHHRL